MSGGTILDPRLLPERLQVKVLSTVAAPPADLIAVFHRWIRTEKLPELLIDVTDYSHVHAGPGVVLIGHDGNYSFDLGDGRPGLLYAGKRVAGAEVLRRALVAARALAGEVALAGKVRFDGAIELRVADRLWARNDGCGWARLEPLARAVGEALCGGARVERTAEDRRELVGARLTPTAPVALDRMIAALAIA